MYKVLEDRVLVEVKPDDISDIDPMLPAEQIFAKVVAKGPKVSDQINVGDSVIIPGMCGRIIKIYGDEMLIILVETNILVILDSIGS